MSETNEFKYSVIQFAEVPYKDVADYVCVPRSWVHARGPNDPKVRVSYPVEDPLETEIRVKKRKKKSDEWNSYLSVIKFRTDDYDDAKRYIERMIPALHNEDNTLPSAKVEGKPRRSKRKNKNKTANTTTVERKAPSDPGEEPHSKRSRLTEPDESDDKTAGAVSQAFEVISKDQSLLHKASDKDQSKQEQSGNVFNRNSSENVPTVKQNPAEGTHTCCEAVLKQEFCGEFIRGVLREIQMDFQVYTASLLAKAVNKIMNNVTVFENTWPYNYTVPLPTITLEKASESNKRNEKQAEGKNTDVDDDEDQPLNKISSPKLIKKVILPPEYDEDDSKWTLKYREPAPGLVELMEYSGVYVKALKLKNCKRLSKDCKSLARMVLSEIFTTSALGTCSWTGARAKAFDQDGTNVRPGLDEHARTVLLNYVAEHARQEGWCFENHTILNSIRNKMQEMRVKYKSKLSKSKLV